MEQLKKVTGKLFSMKTAIGILLLLTVACVLGSVIPQGEAESYYTSTYPGNPARLILLLELNDVFHSVWFVVLTAFLCLNLLGCNLLRFPVILRQMREDYTLDKRLKQWKGEGEVETDDVDGLFRRMGFSKVERRTLLGKEFRYAVRNKIGLWGAWLTHLGMLIIMIGFALGQMKTVKYNVYGIPGTTKQVGDTGYALTIEDFDVTLREDNTVEQYTATLTVTDTATGEAHTGEASVNHPLNLFGMKFYQNSMGWAAQVDIWENDQPLQSQVLCTGEFLPVEDKPELVVMFNSFYPDLTTGPNGMPTSASSELNHPGYLYSVYYNGEVIGMNVLEEEDEITIDDYTVRFSQPQHYTLITAKHDPFTGLVLAGGLVMLAALLIAFYLRTEELWATPGENGRWQVAGRSRKGGVIFLDKLREAAGEQKERTL